MTTSVSPVTIVETKTVEEFFHELVTGALEVLQVDVSTHAQYYMVNLLHEFSHCHKALGTENSSLDEPLALMLKKALEAASPGKSTLHLKQLGDVSLFMSGFFSENLERKVVDVDYYIGMGGSAYAQLAQHFARMPRGGAFGDLYTEMSGCFRSLVEVLNEISDRSRYERDEDLIRLYENWMRTGNERLSRKLARHGFVNIHIPPNTAH
jgi:hypothetical protein